MLKELFFLSAAAAGCSAQKTPVEDLTPPCQVHTPNSAWIVGPEQTCRIGDITITNTTNLGGLRTTTLMIKGADGTVLEFEEVKEGEPLIFRRLSIGLNAKTDQLCVTDLLSPPAVEINAGQ